MFKIFLEKASSLVERLIQLEEVLNDDFLKNNNLDILKQENDELFYEITMEGYEKSYLNPDYACGILGDKLGQLTCCIYFDIFNSIKYAFSHEKNNLFGLRVLIKKMMSQNVAENAFIDIYREYKIETIGLQVSEAMGNRYNINNYYINDIIENSDLKELNYLYKYGKRISKYEIQVAKFFQAYDKEKIRDTAKLIVNAYFQGFKVENKEIGDRKQIRIRFNVGQELLVRDIIMVLKEKGYYGFAPLPFVIEENEQVSYDHRFNNALILDEEYKNLFIEKIKQEYKEKEEILLRHGGIIFFETFGEEPFSPIDKKHALKFTKLQSECMGKIRKTYAGAKETYIPDINSSDTMIAFPSPQIGQNFEEIFEEIMKINTLDVDKYETIQQIIIDALDKADFVQVKGKGTNKTDIRVKMHELQNPERETLYANCGANVNIPVGEIYTSPVLKGTNGVLHLEETFLEGLCYKDLIVVFEDGYVSDYSCKNFEDEAKNLEYIEENLLFNNSTLPMGEFAIGTNTLAYVVAKKYGIMDKLPVLISEKMGPHFAIGDTCFSYVEDCDIKSHINGKYIVAKDNEKSSLRSEDEDKAYTQCHTDIPVLYDNLEFVTGFTKAGESIEIIKNGRFVLLGTEELNKPF
ncbi:MAG: aminopeptidase [Clostridium sp.]|uniref:aminopeptidase n=1 Tax=Clostridium sp. TaxID=1506 RepID=UPI003D6CE466